MKNFHFPKVVRLLLLLGGLTAGVYAVGQVQNIAKRASGVGTVTYKGTLIQTVTDNVSGKSTSQFFVQTDQTTVKPIDPSLVALFKPGTTVTVARSLDSKGLLAPAVSSQALTPSSGVTALAVPSPVTGTRRLAMILVNFQNKTLNGVTKPSATSFLTTQFIPFYKENSFGKLNITGSVFGPYTINMNASCSSDVWSQVALRAIPAADADINYTQFDHVMFVFPNNDCGFTGYANVGSKNTYHVLDGGASGSYVSLYPSWVVDSSFNLRPVAHEFGHNLGLRHAASRDCGDVSFGTSSNCFDTEYVDYWDTMGSLSARHFSSFRKEYLGWLSATNVKTITTSGTYDIYPIESSSTLPQALKIQTKNPTDNSFYYIENRTATGFDNGIESSALNGAVIRLYPVASALFGQNDSVILDMTPNSLSGNEDFTDAALPLNKIFSDPTGGPQGNGLTIIPLSKVNNVLKVKINIGPTPLVDLKLNDQDGPFTVVVNGFVPFTPKEETFNWTSTNVKSCTVMWPTTKTPKTVPTTGSEKLLAGIGKYTITCIGNDNSTVSDSVSINSNLGFGGSR